MTNKILEAVKVLEGIEEGYLITEPVHTILDDYSESNRADAKQSAIEEFRECFDDHNDWIHEDDYPSCDEWVQAVGQFKELVIFKFENN